MNLVAIQDAFHQWMNVLDEQGLSASHIYSFGAQSDSDAKPDGLVVATVLTTVRLDPERRAHANDRQRVADRPLARLGYVVAVSGDAEPLQSEKTLLSLLLEVEHHPAMQLLAEPVSVHWWMAHGLSPRPAFQMEAAVTEAVPTPVAPAIREHAVDMSRTVVIHGQVTWADGRPLPRAQIQLESRGQARATRSDSRGYFQLSTVADDLQKQTVQVKAGDQEQHFTVADVEAPDGHWLLRMTEPQKDN